VSNSDIVEEHYNKLFVKYGDNPQSCQWTNEYSQTFRFKKLMEIDDLKQKKILDVGCGLGDLYLYLKDENILVEYTGVDIVGGMIELAKKKLPTTRFLRQNIIEQPLDEKFDYVLMSGIFNSNLERNDQVNFAYMKNVLTAAYDQCTYGIGFNFISSCVNSRDDEMAYFPPSNVFDFCVLNLSPKVSLFHHYERCDVTVFVYR